MENVITDYLTIESVELMYSYGISTTVNDGRKVALDFEGGVNNASK